ncbi:MAG: phosphate ABC transporter permease subunit PstC [Selenomonadaceae bacterium]|nr:phosphate ABC transporter permease subunit PstC [Selenomonadaceae bacterium]
MQMLFFLCGMLTVAFVVCITMYLVIKGIPAVLTIGPAEFLLGIHWQPVDNEPEFGILPFILTSIYGTAGAVLCGVPIGLITAVFLAKSAPPRLALIIRSAVQLLAGIPSVVYGLTGMIVLVPWIRNIFSLPSGATLLAAIVVLTIMILPSIISVAESSLKAVPKEYEEGSLALGATELESYWRVTVPAAKQGILTAIVLGVGRAVGEAMAILMVAGNVANLPNLFSPVRFLTTALAAEMSYAAVGSLHREALFSIGLVLFLFIVMLNVLLRLSAVIEED